MHVIGVHQAEKSLLEEEIRMDQVSYEFFLYPFVDFLEKKIMAFYVLFLSMVQKGFISFLIWLSALEIFYRFFLLLFLISFYLEMKLKIVYM